MKRITTYTWVLLALAACAKEEGTTGGDFRPELRLGSGIVAATRGDVQSTRIVAGETVYAWVADASTAEALYAAAELIAQEGGALTGAPMYFPSTGHAVNIRALHGSFIEKIEPGSTVFPSGGIGFRVAEDQSEAGGKAYVNSDLLYAAADGVTRTKETVALAFYHMLSKIELKIIKGPGLTEGIRSVKLDDMILSGKLIPDTDLSSAEQRVAMIAVDEEQRGDMLLGTAPDTGGGLTNDAIVVPQMAAGKTLTFTLENGGELVYVFPEGKKFESGKRHLYEVTLTRAGLSVDSSVIPWDDTEEPEKGEARPLLVAKVGDYFYSDGTFSTDLDPKKEVIGIVFSTDPSRIGEAEREALRTLGIAEPHGLVMAVKKASSGSQWHRERDQHDFAELKNCVTKEDCKNDIDGLHHYNTVVAYAEKQNGLESYPVFEAVKNFTVKAPATTTGWYLPAVGQWYDIFANLGGLSGWEEAQEKSPCDYDWMSQSQEVAARLNARMNLLGAERYDAFNPGGDQWLWSSSEYTAGQSRRWCLDVKGIYCRFSNRDYSSIVRPVLAF